MKIFSFLLCLTAAGVASADASSTAVLAEPVKFPLMMGGRRVGESTLQAGARVEVLEQAGSQVLIKFGAAEPQWVEKSAVRELRAATPVEAAPPAAGNSVALSIEAKGEAAPEPVEEQIPESYAADEGNAGGAEPEVLAGGSSTNFKIAVSGSKVPVERWGAGEMGIIFSATPATSPLTFARQRKNTKT